MLKKRLAGFVSCLAVIVSVTLCLPPTYVNAASKKSVAVKSVSLNKTSLKLDKGKSYTLKATVKPKNATKKTVSWTSSNKKVATVNAKTGVVKGVSAGKAKIAAKTANGKKKVCTVTVITPVAVKSVKLNKSSTNIKVGENARLEATVSPSNAANKTVTWTSSNKGVATVRNGIVTGINAGKTEITAKAVNGKIAKCTVTVTAPKTVTKPTSKSQANTPSKPATVIAPSAKSDNSTSKVEKSKKESNSNKVIVNTDSKPEAKKDTSPVAVPQVPAVEKNVAQNNTVQNNTIVYSPNLLYQAHVQDYGWMALVGDGNTAGTTGLSKRMEAITVSLTDYDGSSAVEYRAHCSDIGWMAWKNSGEIAGTVGESRLMEAVQIKLKGRVESLYDIYYRLHVADIGWMGWAKNGETAGTTGGRRQSEAIEIRIVPKGAWFDRGGAAYQQLTEQFSERILDINWNNLRTVGMQPSGSSACSCYALAYCRTILDGTPRAWSTYNPYGNNHYNVNCHWDWGGYVSNSTSDSNVVYRELIKNINAGRPVIVYVTRWGFGHYVTVVGYTGVVSGLTENNFIIIDSGTLQSTPKLESMSVCSLRNEGGTFQYCTAVW